VSEGIDRGRRVLPGKPTTIGRRVWDFFDHLDTQHAHGDLAGARSPWTGTASRPGRSARHDRTEGIPPRTLSMWPNHTPPPPADAAERRRRANRITRDLETLPPPPAPALATAPGLTAALAQIARAVHDQPPGRQRRAIDKAARDHRVDPDLLMRVAAGVGTLITRSRGPDPARHGRPSLNALHDANIPLALDTYLARAQLRHSRLFSDPDLPRLWMTVNGLTHAVPANVLLTIPATNHGPIATVRPTRDDLVGWHGIHDALHELDAVVTAAAEGRSWLAGTTRRQSADDALLAVGIMNLTHPVLAAELARDSAATVSLADIRRLAGRLPAPVHPIHLSDAAVKAHCDRAGYLLGTPDERTHRELIERHLPPAVTRHVRARLAAGDTTALTQALRAVAPTDSDLDRHVWRHNPPQPGAVHLRHLLGEASREALRRFAGHDIHPHPSRAVALLARYPERTLHTGLRLTADQLTVQTGPPRYPEPTGPPPSPPDLAL
jgi:hypothetical protein